MFISEAPQTAKNALNDAISSTDIINKGTDLVDSKSCYFVVTFVQKISQIIPCIPIQVF